MHKRQVTITVRERGIVVYVSSRFTEDPLHYIFACMRDLYRFADEIEATIVKGA